MEYMQVNRANGRTANELRPVRLTRGVMKHAHGSCLAEFGDTRVLCAATIEEGVPGWRKGAKAGWVTAEYAMLPASTGKRCKREYAKRKGRSMEIERLIGRSLRTVVNMKALGEYTVTVDCDVIQADGGTRTASITGAWVALRDALAMWVEAGKIERIPLIGQVAAISMGVVDGNTLLDLDYSEDSHAEVDMNLVATDTGEMIELQGTGEQAPFDRKRLNALLDLGDKGIAELMDTFYADGYDATTPGNHDWSYGADKLRTMTGYSTTGTPFAMLCANAKSTSGVWSSSITKTLDRTWEDSEDHSTFDYKIKVGVVGAMDESLGSSLRADLVAGTSFSSAANAINAEAEQLRKEGCDVVVCIAHTLDAKTFATRLRGVDALIAGHEHINLNEKVTGADGKTIHVVEAGSAFAEVGLLSIPYKYDTNGTETTDDDTVTVPADDSDEKLYTAKNVNDLLADPDKGSDYQSRLEAVRNKIKPLDDAFEIESNKVLGTSTTNYFYGEDAVGTHGWEMVRTTDFRPSKEGDTPRPRPSAM